MALLNSLLSWWMKKRIHQIDLFLKYPYDVQQEVFHKLIQSAQNTEYGKKYSYSDIKTPKQFRERVPIVNYDSLKPYIQRVMKGEQNILWHSEIKWFAKSSGTTSDKSKFIPVSKEAIEDCHFKGAISLEAGFRAFFLPVLQDAHGCAVFTSGKKMEVQRMRPISVAAGRLLKTIYRPSGC